MRTAKERTGGAMIKRKDKSWSVLQRAHDAVQVAISGPTSVRVWNALPSQTLHAMPEVLGDLSIEEAVGEGCDD